MEVTKVYILTRRESVQTCLKLFSGTVPEVKGKPKSCLHFVNVREVCVKAALSLAHRKVCLDPRC